MKFPSSLLSSTVATCQSERPENEEEFEVSRPALNHSNESAGLPRPRSNSGMVVGCTGVGETLSESCEESAHDISRQGVSSVPREDLLVGRYGSGNIHERVQLAFHESNYSEWLARPPLVVSEEGVPSYDFHDEGIVACEGDASVAPDLDKAIWVLDTLGRSNELIDMRVVVGRTGVGASLPEGGNPDEFNASFPDAGATEKSVRFYGGEEGNPVMETREFEVETEVTGGRSQSEIRRLRRFLHSLRNCENAFLAQKNETAEKGRALLKSIRDSLSEAEPVKDALRMFKSAYELGASCPRYSPTGHALPVGLVFTESDLEKLSSAQCQLTAFLQSRRADFQEVSQLVHTLHAQALKPRDEAEEKFVPVNVSKQPELPSLTVLDAYPLQLKDGSSSSYLKFDGKQETIFEVQTPLLFWGEFLRATVSEGWDETPLSWAGFLWATVSKAIGGGGTEEDRLLERNREFQVTVLKGDHWTPIP